MKQTPVRRFRWTEENSLALSRILVAVMLALAVAALFCIPVVTEWYDAVSYEVTQKKGIALPLNIALYISDGLFTGAMLTLYRMLGNIAGKKVFVTENVRHMRIISWCCFAVAAVWGVLGCLRLLALLVAFLAAFAGIILRVMKNLFAMAVRLREENDYTI